MPVTAQVGIAIAVGLAATVEDIATRRISNWIPLVALGGGFGWHIYEQGWKGILSAGLGTLAGFGVFLVFYLLGGMGGGDVKLMGGFGALLGAARSLEAALWTGLCGGLLALGVLGFAAIRRLGKPSGQAAVPVAIPYAPAITAGVWLSLVPR